MDKFQEPTNSEPVRSVGADYGLGNCGIRAGFPEKKNFYLPQCPDRLWFSTSLLSNGYQG
jgi:hypothetical protein